MTLHTFSTNPSNSAGGNIATWAQGVSNGIVKAGLVRVAGSHAALGSGTFAGASDFSALAAPGAINTTVAWEIWRFADTLQATTPVYIQIWYGSGNLVTVPALWIAAGFDLNNAVTPTALAGQVFAQQQIYSGNVTTTVANCLVSGTTGRLCIGVFYDLSPSALLITVERLHNADGSDNDEGIFVFCVGSANPGSQKNQVICRPTFGASGESGSFLCGVWPSSNTTAWGSDFHVTPVFPVRGRVLPPSRNIMAARSADIANGAAVSLPLYGANRAWAASGGGAWQANFGASLSASIYLLRNE